MRIHYSNRFSDILLFNAAHQFLSPLLQALFFALCAFIYWSELAENSSLCASITALLWYFGIWIFQFLFNAIYLFSRKNHSVLTDHVIELQPDGLLEETKFNRSLFYWPGIVKAVSRPGFVAVYVTPHLAHIVPNRAFTDTSERMEFLAHIQGKINASRT